MALTAPRPPWGRVAFALALCVEAVPKAIDMPELLHHARGAEALGLIVALALVGLAGRWCLRDDARAGWAVVALFGLCWGAERLSEDGQHAVRHGSLLPVSALIAALAAPRLAGQREPGLAQEAAWGAVGAVYTLAGVSKVLGSGLGWFAPTHLGLLILERAPEAPEPLQSVRLAVAGSPALCVVLATVALLAELAGVLLIWPRARPFVATALMVTHLGIAALMGYVYMSWVILLFGLTWGRLDDELTAEAPLG